MGEEERLIGADGDPLVFVLKDRRMRELLQQMRPGLTVHGFRSSFRDWCAEQTNFPRELAEVALAHTVGDATERAYQRADLFEKRRLLMDAWAKYCEKPVANEGDNVLTIPKRG